MSIVQERPLRAAGAHDQVDRDPREHALRLGASGRGEVNRASGSRRRVYFGGIATK
jgi:hypothetical protein